MGNVRTKLKTFIRKNNIILLIAALAVILLFCSPSLFGNKKEVTETDTDTYSGEYAKALETRLEGIVTGINGVESCRVMVTLDGGIEYVYASDNQHSTSSGKKESSEGKTSLTVLSDKQSGEKAVVVKEIYPEIKGVAIVCKGVDSPSVILEVTKAASTVLGINSDKVCVIIEN